MSLLKHAPLILRVALASVLVAAVAHTRADPDLWGHIRFGQDMVSAHAIRLADHYSFASDRPWINHEWLAESTMYLVYAVGGATGLIVLKVALLFALVSLVWLTLRAAHLPATTLDLLIGLLVIGTIGQGNHVRPQLFSLVLFAALLAALHAASRGRRTALVAAVPIMAIWANAHGGWLVGAGTLGVWAGVGLFARLEAREKRLVLCVAAIALTATLANPYGWGLWIFLRDTVGFGRPDIAEWQPGYRLGIASVLVWSIVAAAATAPLVHRTTRASIDPRIIAVVAMLGVASFRVDRLVAFFTIAVVALMGPHVAKALHRSDTSHRTVSVPPRLAAAVAIAIAAAIFLGSVAAAFQNTGCIRMDADRFPEPDVAAFVASHDLQGRMLTWFDWGEYAIWHFSPAITVSFDGRRETVYSEAAIQQQLTLYSRPAERKAIIDSLQPTYIWLPSNLAITADLIADGWTPMLSGNRSMLLGRENYGAPAILQATQPARCFPGP